MAAAFSQRAREGVPDRYSGEGVATGVLVHTAAAALGVTTLLRTA